MISCILHLNIYRRTKYNVLYHCIENYYTVLLLRTEYEI